MAMQAEIFKTQRLGSYEKAFSIFDFFGSIKREFRFLLLKEVNQRKYHNTV